MDNTNNNTGKTGLRPENPHLRQGEWENEIKPYIAMMLRGKWWILIITLIVFNIGLYNVMQEEPIYQATTSVMLKSRGSQNIIPGFGTQIGRNIRNEIEILKSRPLAADVAESLLERMYLDKDSTKIIPSVAEYSDGVIVGIASLNVITNRVRSRVSFDHLRDSDIILITAQSGVPEETALLSQTYAEIYYKRSQETSRTQSRSVRAFLEAQLINREHDLKNAENQLQEYMELHSITSVDRESQHVIDQISALEARNEELTVEIESLKRTIASIENQIEEQEPGVAKGLGSGDDSYIRILQQELAEAEIQRDRVIAQNPETAGVEHYQNRLNVVDERIRSLRETLNRRIQEYLRSLTPGDAQYLRHLMQRLIEGEIELHGLLLRKEATENSLREYERQFESLPRKTMEFARLQRAHQSAEQLYLFIEQRYNESLIAEQSEFGIVEIVEPAVIPRRPISPNIQRSLMMAIIFGLALGSGFVFLKDKMSSILRTPEDIKKLNLNPLTTIAKMNAEIKRISKRGTISLSGRTIDAHIITAANPISPITESFRWLRTNLMHLNNGKTLRTLLLTSPNPSEGKSTIASNLAVVSAHSGKRVLLVDTDFRKPTLHKKFDLSVKPGLTNVVFDELSVSDVIQRTVFNNLDFLACGTIPQNPADIIDSPKMKELVDSLKELYDLIIFDSAPVLAATDPCLIASIVDGVIVVVQANKTRKEELNIVKESVETVGSKVSGVVLNRFDPRNEYGYNYTTKYYRYGSYGVEKMERMVAG
jgi:capsular exopolysaccharide synthesis family protein